MDDLWKEKKKEDKTEKKGRMKKKKRKDRKSGDFCLFFYVSMDFNIMMTNNERRSFPQIVKAEKHNEKEEKPSKPCKIRI